uniref:RtcB family protein n=1 Tax=uncultured Allisonella sp. TaxID=339338 RepID=UPI00266EA894|nr:RtcB family protein [uncultured Allisonella sp.]
MYTINLGKQSIDFARLDEAAHIVPSGMNVWPEKQADFDLQQLYCHDKLKKLSWIACSIGTLGGGNHFIEVDETYVAGIISSSIRAAGTWANRSQRFISAWPLS